MPRFSILMANYGHAKWMPRAVESVLAQTFKDWELVFVDDCSKDRSMKVISKYKDPRIKVHRRKFNGGFGKTLRTAAKRAVGDIFCLLDPDDAIREDTLKVIDKAYRKHPDVGFVYSQYIKCDVNLKPKRRGDCGPLPKGMTWLDVMDKLPKPRPRVGHLKTFLRSAYLKTDGFTRRRRTVDKDIVFKLEEVTKLLYVDEELYYYRMHSGGISRTVDKSYQMTVIEEARTRRQR